ncbi:MAG: hypothetical protein K2X45_07940 [Phreatobacter sp.]|nr:hypothetical protein [Phreatobacter sp.]
MTTSKLRTERADKDAHRIMDGDKVVAMALRLTNDQWIVCDTRGNRYPGVASTIQCKTPRGCIKVYEDHVVKKEA